MNFIKNLKYYFLTRKEAERAINTIHSLDILLEICSYGEKPDYKRFYTSAKDMLERYADGKWNLLA